MLSRRSFRVSLVGLLGLVLTLCLVAAAPLTSAILPARERVTVPEAPTTTVTFDELSQATAYSIYRGPNASRYVIATYDDCMNGTPARFRANMQWLRDHGFAVVLAPTGNCIKSFKARGMDIEAVARSYGQWVINHSVTHAKLTTLTVAGINKELSAPGVITNYGRPPYGSYNATVSGVYAQRGMKKWLWDVDTRDWDHKTCAQIVAHAVKYAKPGSTVLMHMHTASFTTTCMGQLFVALYKQRGLLVCRVYRGPDNVGPVVTTPRLLPGQLPCGL